jgi:hypothetical protein
LSAGFKAMILSPLRSGGRKVFGFLSAFGFRISEFPGTIMTDPEVADRTYIEPIAPECVEKIIVREKDEMKQSARRANWFF